ncbi:MAG: phenylacetate-CoA oxygenase subunit PaaJ [Rhizobiaceae bacterium]|nr:phenylacetate-CoA oxygenase subunit PaaJ [Rhizobiaceae bacterium]
MVELATKHDKELENLIWKIAEEIPDPEIPVIPLGDLGIVRGVEIDERGRALIKLTPTYSGCPAIQLIEDTVRTALENAGIVAAIERVISPPWTTDWISKAGREKLRAYGIAPPQKTSSSKPALFESDTPRCPRCDSIKTQLVSQFGSTPCKAHYVCKSCREPFDYFKCL